MLCESCGHATHQSGGEGRLRLLAALILVAKFKMEQKYKTRRIRPHCMDKFGHKRHLINLPFISQIV